MARRTIAPTAPSAERTSVAATTCRAKAQPWPFSRGSATAWMLSVEAEFIDHHDHSRPLSGGEALDRQTGALPGHKNWGGNRCVVTSPVGFGSVAVLQKTDDL